MAAAEAAAPAAEPFSIRNFAARMRTVDAAKCFPFGGAGDGEPEPPLPPMDPPPRARWWAHELAALQARPGVDLSLSGGEAAVCGGEVSDAEKGTKRKGSRESNGAERAKRRRRAIQLSFLFKRKERSSKPQSVPRLLQQVLHKGLLRKRKSRYIDMGNSLFRRKAAKSFVDKRSIKVSRSTDHALNPAVRHVANPPKDDIFGDLPLLESSKVMFQTGVDILPAIMEDPFVMNQSEQDAISETVSLELLTASDITTQPSYPLEDLVEKEGTPDEESTRFSLSNAGRSLYSSAECDAPLNHRRISVVKTCLGDMQLKSTGIPVLSSCSSEGPSSGPTKAPQRCFYAKTNYSQEIKEPGTSSAMSSASERTRIESAKRTRDAAVNGISLSDAGRSHSSSAEFDASFNRRSISMARTCLGDMQLKSTDIPALRSCSSVGPKSGSSNPQRYFYAKTNCSQEIKEPSTSYAMNLSAVKTRIEAAKRTRDASVDGKKGTDISGRLVRTKYHLSSEGSALSSSISQGSVNAGTIGDGMSSCSRIPSQEYVPTSIPFGKLPSNEFHETRKSVDTRASLLMEGQGSWYSKHQPIGSPASVGLAFMKLPGLERMEISNCSPATVENRFTNGRSMNAIRCQKQQLVSGMTNNSQGQSKIGFSDSQAGKKGPDGYVEQNSSHSHQPTVRLMGKTLSVCKHGEDQKSSTRGKLWIDNSIPEKDRSSSIACQLPRNRLFTCQDSVIPRAHINESSDIVRRIPNSSLSEARSTSTIGDLQSQRLQPVSSVSLTAKDCAWNCGSQFISQAEMNKACMIGANSGTRRQELHQTPQVINLPQNQHPHLCGSASNIPRKDPNLDSAVNQTSPSFPHWMLNTGIRGKHQQSTLSSYDDPSSVPIHQPCEVPGSKLSSASFISFRDYGINNAETRNSYQGTRPLTSLASKSISTISPACTGSLPNIDGRKGAAFIDQRNKRPAYADNVSQQPARGQIVTDKLELTTPIVPNMKSHSLGWSLSDAVGPRILDFSKKIAGHDMEISRNENNSFKDSSGPVPVVETRSRTVSLVAGAKTMLKPGQNLNDHSKLLYSTKFSVDNGVNSVAL